jgi:hypothetical protein
VYTALYRFYIYCTEVYICVHERVLALNVEALLSSIYRNFLYQLIRLMLIEELIRGAQISRSRVSLCRSPGMPVMLRDVGGRGRLSWHVVYRVWVCCQMSLSDW